MLSPKRDEHYTYDDYRTWDDGKRWELISGVAYAMAPAPSMTHQRISMRLSRMLSTFLIGKPCEAFAAPFDVRLNADDEDDTVVQPDLVVICDRSKISEQGCKGAPDLVIEILSPASARHDRWLKFNLYKNVGVREYWIVNPEEKDVEVFILKEGEFIRKIYVDTDAAPISILPGCEINLQEVFLD